MMKKNKIKILLLIGIVVLIIVAVLFFLLRQEDYRSIQVYNVEGSAEVDREEIGILDAYSGMMLQSEDDVTVETESYLYLKLDEDKFVLLEPGTKVHLQATGNSENSKTRIYLESGAVVSRLDNELSLDSVYEVTTPNSTMAVRGTIFGIEVSQQKEGEESETKILVFEGAVDSKLIMPDGQVNDHVIQVTSNTKITIQATNETTEFVGEPEAVEEKALPEGGSGSAFL